MRNNTNYFAHSASYRFLNDPHLKFHYRKNNDGTDGYIEVRKHLRFKRLKYKHLRNIIYLVGYDGLNISYTILEEFDSYEEAERFAFNCMAGVVDIFIRKVYR